MKKWYQSWTIWTNIIAIVLVVINHAVLSGWVTPEIEAAVIAVANVILRVKTNSGITK